MNKNVIAIIVFLILLVIFASAFSSSYTSHNISNLAYVLALGIDVGEKAKMNKMHRNDTSSIILPSRQTLPPLRPKTLQKPTAIQK